MRILVIDEKGNALDWVMRCRQDGHAVKWFIRETEKTKHIGRGLAEIVRDFHPWLAWSELIVCTDNVKYLKELEAWRSRGWPIVGGSVESAAWELDRTAGMKVLKRHGISVPPYREFSNYDQAIAYVKSQGRPFVSKPCGDEPDKSLSYVAKTPADLVYMLERWKKARRHKGAFILQEKIEGCEMAVGGWFGPGGFNDGWCENWEFKKLMTGDLGVATGEQGTVLRYVKRSKLANMVLAPLANALEKMGYVGYVDVNTIIDDKGTPWPLEFTMRFGWPTFNIQQALHEGDHAEWLACLSEGRDGLRGKLSFDRVATGVVLSIPDYPYSHITRKEVIGIPVYGLPPSMRLVSPCEMMAGEAPHDLNGKVVTQPCLVTAGDYVLVAMGLGDTVRASRASAYRRLDRIKVPNSPMWRIDIGQRLREQLPAIQRHGFATSLSY
jgi:phosphoribosylamine--glycine ligase